MNKKKLNPFPHPHPQPTSPPPRWDRRWRYHSSTLLARYGFCFSAASHRDRLKRQRLSKNKVVMPSTSNLKQQKRNWLDLPSDVTANILKRIGAVDILENAQKVCTAWRKIYKDPAMWRVIYMNALQSSPGKPSIINMCKRAVDRSQGQLVDITFHYAYDDDLLLYVADRSSQLRRLELASGIFFRSLTTDALINFPLLEELNLYSIKISKEDIETVGRYCPMLKTLKVNRRACRLRVRNTYGGSLLSVNEIAIAIGQNLVGLKHLLK
ncbi:hypothetical protein L1987_35034 [Smallanthus sonchifolius]|uniref:Uncharacterized protein n=1 Tax=Smallanthus sonchifolius TaxID=185202 RepID=A0ACB9HUW5_9ASTR|nr:hypothetical protein L1987_35034 [Smallanthus sonchifolius]